VLEANRLMSPQGWGAFFPVLEDRVCAHVDTGATASNLNTYCKHSNLRRCLSTDFREPEAVSFLPSVDDAGLMARPRSVLSAGSNGGHYDRCAISRAPHTRKPEGSGD
jgi:hypothetical protein